MRYPVKAIEDKGFYEFHSEGSNGRIKMGIVLTHIGENLFYLGFGDWNEEKRKLNDFSRINNGDTDKILGTVASAVLDFTDNIPHARIFFEGSTSSRTRLYQMEINNNLMEVNERFEVQGFINDHWEAFRAGRNFEAFLVKRK